VDISSITNFDEAVNRINRGENCGRLARKVVKEMIPNGVATFPLTALVQNSIGERSRLAFAIEVAKGKAALAGNRMGYQDRSMGFRSSIRNVNLVNMTVDLVFVAGPMFRRELTVRMILEACSQLISAAWDMSYGMNGNVDTSEIRLVDSYFGLGSASASQSRTLYRSYFNTLVDAPVLTEDMYFEVPQSVQYAAAAVRPEVMHVARKLFPMKRRYWTGMR